MNPVDDENIRDIVDRYYKLLLQNLDCLSDEDIQYIRDTLNIMADRIQSCIENKIYKCFDEME